MTTIFPAARTPDPRKSPILRWGILGPGWIGQRFTEALLKNTEQEIVAVGSRSLPRAQNFADRYGIDHAHGSYESLLSDDAVEIVYISTPHTEHHAGALAALDAGKHVLIEKPMGINRRQAVDVFSRACELKLFAGEAMWMKFLPKYDVIRQVLDSGVLGAVHTVLADNGEFFTSEHRIYNPALAGGPMLDLGIYPVSLSQWVLGDIDSVVAVGQAATSELNGQVSAALTHSNGNQSSINTSILTATPRYSIINGQKAFLTIPGPFYQPGPFSVTFLDGSVSEHDESYGFHEDGLHFSAAEAARVIASGGRQSVIHPPSDVLSTLDAMDKIRSEVGIVFPGE